MGQRPKGDGGGPDLINQLEDALARQIRINLVALARGTGVPRGVDRLNPHQAHEALDMPAIDPGDLSIENAGEPPHPEEGVGEVQRGDASLGVPSDGIPVLDDLARVLKQLLASGGDLVGVHAVARSDFYGRGYASNAMRNSKFADRFLHGRFMAPAPFSRRDCSFR